MSSIIDNEKQRLRIALVTGCLNLGGTTTFLCNFGGELIRRGIPATVISFEDENPLASDFERAKIPVTRFSSRGLIFEDRIRKSFAELARFQPSVVLANLGAISFEILRHAPKGVFRIGAAQSDHPLVYESLNRYASAMDAAAAVSQSIKSKIAAAPEFKNIPVHYLPYGVPIAEFPGNKPNRDKPLRILYLGRLYREQKRVELFPRIFEGIKTAGIPFHWTIAGEGPERIFLQQEMKGTAEQTVSFTGTVAYEAVPKLLLDHDIFFLASDYEGLPLSLLEAMGAGLVPVVSDLPSGIPEVVDSSNGMLVPISEVDRYSNAIVHLHHHRDELAAKSILAHQRAKAEFSVEAMTDRWLAVFPKNFPAIEWRSDVKIRPALTDSRPFYFSSPMRWLRRIGARLRN